MNDKETVSLCRLKTTGCFNKSCSGDFSIDHEQMSILILFFLLLFGFEHARTSWASDSNY